MACFILLHICVRVWGDLSRVGAGGLFGGVGCGRVGRVWCHVFWDCFLIGPLFSKSGLEYLFFITRPSGPLPRNLFLSHHLVLGVPLRRCPGLKYFNIFFARIHNSPHRALVWVINFQNVGGGGWGSGGGLSPPLFF